MKLFLLVQFIGGALADGKITLPEALSIMERILALFLPADRSEPKE